MKEREYKKSILPDSKVKDTKTGLDKYALTWTQLRAIISEEKELLIDEIENQFLVQRDNTEPIILVHFESEWNKFKKVYGQ